MSAKPKIIITGANGFLGSVLVNHFCNKGWSVIGLVQRVPSSSPEHVRYVAYDMLGELDDTVFKDADYLVHTALVRYDKQHPNALQQNVAAARALLKASRKYHVKKNVFISSMSAHQDAISVYGRQKLAVEKVFNTNQDISLRSGLLLGDGGLFKQMAAHIRTKHIVPIIDGGRQPLQFIAVEELARVIEKVLASDLHGVLTIAHPQILTNKQFYHLIAKKFKATLILVPLPFTLLQFLIRTAAKLHLPIDISEENLLGLKALRAVDTRPDVEQVGIKLTPIETVIKRIRLS
jgi:nucleoside-diphosphate-sugar epimerase